MKTCHLKQWIHALHIIVFSPQNFITDLAANSKRMSEINHQCDQLIKSNHMQSTVIKRRQKQLIVSGQIHSVLGVCV